MINIILIPILAITFLWLIYMTITISFTYFCEHADIFLYKIIEKNKTKTDKIFCKNCGKYLRSETKQKLN